MLRFLKSQWQIVVAVLLFISLTLFWIYLQINFQSHPSLNQLFSDTYGVMALWGGIWGLILSRHWGGIKSSLGRAVAFLSFGLLAQEFGQLAYSYYFHILHVNIPYPSLGDVGYFGSIPLYIIAVYNLGKVTGVNIKLRTIEGRLQAFIIPILMLGLGYFLFLQEYKFDWSQPIKVFLDFGYPLGEAIYISLTILTLLLSRSILGGIMKKTILAILFSLVLQFFADYTFLYQSANNTWASGGINDYMYLVAYLAMTLSLLHLNLVFLKIQNKE